MDVAAWAAGNFTERLEAELTDEDQTSARDAETSPKERQGHMSPAVLAATAGYVRYVCFSSDVASASTLEFL